MPFFSYRQNNTGGSFLIDDAVGETVWIEAGSAKEADAKALDIGIYFDGCSSGSDCSCCGDRWCPAFSEWGPEEGTAAPEHYGDQVSALLEGKKTVTGFNTRWHIYYADGRHDDIDVRAGRKAS